MYISYISYIYTQISNIYIYIYIYLLKLAEAASMTAMKVAAKAKAKVVAEATWLIRYVVEGMTPYVNMHKIYSCSS